MRLRKLDEIKLLLEQHSVHEIMLWSLGHIRQKKRRNQKGAAFFLIFRGVRLFNLSFLKFYVFPYNRVVLTFDHFLSQCTRVLFGYVEVAGVRCANQLDLDAGRLCHRILQENSLSNHSM